MDIWARGEFGYKELQQGKDEAEPWDLWLVLDWGGVKQDWSASPAQGSNVCLSFGTPRPYAGAWCRDMIL